MVPKSVGYRTGSTNRAWQINKINRINNGLINRCKVGLGLIWINNGLIWINN